MHLTSESEDTVTSMPHASCRPLRVLSCIHRSHLGGGQRRVQWVAEALRPHGVETLVLFPKDVETEYEDLLQQSGMPYVRMRFPYLRRLSRVFTNLGFVFSLPWVVSRMRRLIEQERIDIVHVNGVSNLQPVLAALRAGRPLVWHLNDMLTPRLFVRLVSPLFTHPLVRMAVAAPAILDHYGLSRMVPSAVRLPAPFIPGNPNESSREQVRRSLGLSDGHAVLGFVGNLVPLKGAHDFVKVAEALMAERPDLHAVLVGAEFRDQRAYAARVRAAVAASPFQGRFHLVGYQPDVPLWLSAFDAFVFPSYSEACPIAMLEAMNAGVPVAATAVGDVPFMLDGTGLPLLSPGDIGSITQVARTLLDMPTPERERLFGLLRRRVQSFYTLEAVAARHLRLYAEAAGRAPSASEDAPEPSPCPETLRAARRGEAPNELSPHTLPLDR